MIRVEYKMHTAGHVEIITQWLVDNIGESSDRWYNMRWQMDEFYEAVLFARKEDAVLFTLRWVR